MAISKGEQVPEELIIDILSRLPPKSIGQFRCVSKRWLSLLTDTQFLKTHFATHTNQKQEKGIIFLTESHHLHTITKIQNPPNGIHDPISRELKFQQLKAKWGIICGSCNGLVFILTWDDKIILINPTTKEYHVIPFPICVPGSCSRVHGLGYDVVSDDFKVVILGYHETNTDSDDDDDDDENEPEIVDVLVDVYSVKMGIWRRLDIPLHKHPSYDFAPGVLVNGVLHWLAGNSLNHSFGIVAFDLSVEKFLEVPKPTALDKDARLCSDLVALGGCLCLYSSTSESNIEVWMMKEYGIEESWTKIEIIAPIYVMEMTPLCLIGDDDLVLVVDGEKLMVCNMKEDQWRYMRVDENYTSFACFDAFMESLVSPTLWQGM